MIERKPFLEETFAHILTNQIFTFFPSLFLFKDYHKRIYDLYFFINLTHAHMKDFLPTRNIITV